MFKDILAFLDLIVEMLRLKQSTLFPRNQYSKNEINRVIISHKNLMLKKLKINMFKIDVWTFW